MAIELVYGFTAKNKLYCGVRDKGSQSYGSSAVHHLIEFVTTIHQLENSGSPRQEHEPQRDEDDAIPDP